MDPSVGAAAGSGEAAVADPHGREVFKATWPRGAWLRDRALTALQVSVCVFAWVVGAARWQGEEWASRVPLSRGGVAILCLLPAVARVLHTVGSFVIVPGQQRVVDAAVWITGLQRVRNWAPRAHGMALQFVAA